MVKGHNLTAPRFLIAGHTIQTIVKYKTGKHKAINEKEVTSETPHAYCLTYFQEFKI